MEAALDAGLRQPVGRPRAGAGRPRRARRRAGASSPRVVGAAPGEVVFTSGGTEADNLAVRGVLAARGGTAVCTAIEHKAVLEPVRASGGRVVPVDDRGLVDLDGARRASSTTPSPSSRSGSSTTRSAPCSRSTTSPPSSASARPTRCSTPTPPRRSPGSTSREAAAAGRPRSRWPRTSAAARSASARWSCAPGCASAPQQIGGGQERERRSGTQDVASAVGVRRRGRARPPTQRAGAGRAGAARGATRW